MKKRYLIICIILNIIILSVAVYANYEKIINALMVSHSIIVDGKDEPPSNIQQISIDDRVYIPVDDLNKIFDVDVEMIDNQINITTCEEKKPIIYNVGLDLAANIADILVKDEKVADIEPEEYMRISERFITENKNTYRLARYIRGVAGGSIEVTISKKDGRIICMELGE